MANLKEVKGRIQSVTSTQQITKAMKMVAASKLKRAQDKATRMTPYVKKLNQVLENVSAGLEDDVENAYARKSDIRNVLIIPVTSDKGLCGAFNANINKACIRLIEEKYAYLKASKGITIMPLGKKGMEFFKKKEFNMINDHVGIFNHLEFDNVKPVAEFAMNQFVSGKYDRVEIVFNEFKNAAVQIVQNQQFLPLTEAPQEVLEVEAKKVKKDYIMEPDRESIIRTLIPTTLKIQFYKALLESNASEHGARMTSMDKATENAGELLKDLKLQYNRSRQAAITTEILEIVAGAEALGK
ncbi:MAG: ATP synthase F1 subunit gamma [Cyclobacteriaceae bacterium]|nr:ATP synthase F1 subunit gamma [Cyclobacteriaceae bacterium]MCH8515011.1 ATP synthase F1 subunit gamma [Cyclobacteriaceae bacterium]